MSQSSDHLNVGTPRVHVVEGGATLRSSLRPLPERQLAWDRLWRILLTPRSPGAASSAPDGTHPNHEQVAA